MNFLINTAHAAAAAPAPSPHDSTFSLVMVVAIFVLFYFMLIRPQNRRAKEHRALITNLKKGDEIITSGGLLAKVTALEDAYIKVMLAEGVEVSLQRHAVNTVLPKGTLKSL